MLRVCNLRVRRSGLSLLNGIDFDLRSGDVLALVGKNGSGKSTLLKTLAGFIRADSGAIFWRAHNVTRWRLSRRISVGIGYAFQQPQPLMRFDVSQAIALVTRNRILPQHRGALAAIESRFDRKAPIATLAYLQQKMLDWLLTLLLHPSLFLMDEPFAGLSQPEARALLELIQTTLPKDTTVIFAEHKLAPIEAFATRVAVLEEGNLRCLEALAPAARASVLAELMGDAPAVSSHGTDQDR